ncbi:MAG: potassium channel protein [Spirochaetaceae bacterium]|nr:MAG: potassium channel protein [Spirochaetaceae bacterium]
MRSRIVSRLARSHYTRPALFLVSFFVFASVLMIVFERSRNDQFANLIDGFWWAVITISTTGYGDKVPITLGGRIMAVLVILIGVGAMSLLSGGLASWFVDRSAKARRGLMEFRKQKHHLVVCGWKNDMEAVLLDIVRTALAFTASNIVVVSNVDGERVEELQQESELRDLKFVRGDYYADASLRRAGVTGARKVLVLADELESSAPSEVDSKTVMTVLTAKAIRRDVYVTAELMDAKFEGYLRQAACDEVLLSRELSRHVLASSSATNGMSHIIHALLSDSGGRSRLVTEEVPSDFIDRPFADYRAALAGRSETIVLGVLENTGSPVRMKIESLREAQKTSDVSKLVSNLQKVKELEVNRPVLLPPDDYLVPRYSQAILLTRSNSVDAERSRG